MSHQSAVVVVVHNSCNATYAIAGGAALLVALVGAVLVAALAALAHVGQTLLLGLLAALGIAHERLWVDRVVQHR